MGEYWEEDFLVATSNGYKWNSKYDVLVDMDELLDFFEYYCKCLRDNEAYTKIEEISLKALEIYDKEERAYYWFIFSLFMQRKYSFAKKPSK